MLKIWFLSTVLSLGHGLFLNKVNNFRIIADQYQVLLNKTENECICEVISSNQMISTLNYFLTNQTCQLFYSNLTTFNIEWNMNWSLVYTYESILVSNLGKFIVCVFLCLLFLLVFVLSLEICFFFQNRINHDNDNNNIRTARLVFSINHFYS